ncbi:ankyrin repeat and SOCS box 13-like [Lecanosticta acicola]|uniref:Ankyrin repeat and SOCS box 13-like n=1 Tax=Lecanosticta acicola TaxID=111012 RepID=A0AAI8YXR9_9PEZI|nr:ankyrin repeat and SOCS box 13-like [Lecanosticta acicola]
MTIQAPSPPNEHVDTLQRAIEGLDSELDPSSPDTILDAAIRSDNKALVRQTMRSMKGTSFLPYKRLAIILGKSEMLRTLLEVDGDLDDESVVEAALECKDCASLDILLDFGWRIKMRLGMDSSPLDFAVDDLSLTQFLVRRGADVNDRSSLDESPLSLAIGRGSMDVVRYLIDEGTDLTHGADLVEELAKKGARVNAYRFHNRTAFRWRGLRKQPTALHIASRTGNMPVAEALFRYGADPYLPMLQASKLTRPSSFDIALEEKNAILVDLFTGNLAPARVTCGKGA